MTSRMRATAPGHAALKAGSECSFTTRKLRFLACFRLAYPSLAKLSSDLCRRFLTAVVLGLALLGTAQAAIDTYEFANETERERYRTLVEELRCPKCQNQNIADSDAPIAMDLREQIFRMLEEGQSDPQIIDFLVSRYGDFVLYKPPVNARTLLLWYGPAGLLAGGFVLVGVILVRRRRKPGATANGLSADEEQRLAALLSKPSTYQPPVDKRD
jgi:cytochrome c-type biogenesis protein CcmH